MYNFILHSYVFGQLSLSLYSFFKKTQLNNEAGTLNYPFSEFIFIKVMYIVHLPRFINSLKYLQNVIPVELLCTINYFTVLFKLTTMQYLFSVILIICAA